MARAASRLNAETIEHHQQQHRAQVLASRKVTCAKDALTTAKNQRQQHEGFCSARPQLGALGERLDGWRHHAAAGEISMLVGGNANNSRVPRNLLSTMRKNPDDWNWKQPG